MDPYVPDILPLESIDWGMHVSLIGKANAALVRVLAKEWGLPKSTMAITGGMASRRKTLFIAGDSRDLMTRLKRWMKDKL